MTTDTLTTTICPECDGEGRELIPYGPNDEMDWAWCSLCQGEGEIPAGMDLEPEGDTSAHDAPYDWGRAA